MILDVILFHAPLLLAALILDAIFGEPRAIWSRVPHPAVLMGRLVDWADDRFNIGEHPKATGVAVILGLSVLAIGIGVILALIPLGWLWQILVAAILLAQRSLSDHVLAVADALRGSTEQGRQMVAMIVGRDTAAMDAADISRAAIESAAENMSDGVVAPAFWFLIAGLPGLIFFKMINTADSMIGHRTPRHEEFGWAAARLDDLLNWLPARLTAVLIASTHRGTRAWAVIRADARKHRSPNAGWPEAAMAGVLDVALSGPRSYDGTVRDYPFVNARGARSPAAIDIEAAAEVLWRAWAILAAAVAILWIL
ncbi:MAG: adenosylcobinamide-phosphate synthase CbiB [Rhodobacteraceae bacterium]|nr:adenosylcobinamide-phosphate synthase CbiB [Paracoccaceae bacterium]